ncbi:hypothetical protein OS493_019208 [Desmophyllum pertusum]|uniref:Uncharacterized protein n=1 Tax=Desmophyllum pertusum TaxID=174260 RepID=A0A9W9YBK9_9CNID|nr:hypothetical protein OS493_019208 [Desmophyllum pertusum]
MYVKDRSSYVSPGTVLSFVCLLLYSAGFIRIELKLNDHDQRLVAVEEVIYQLGKQKMADQASNEVLARTTQVTNNNAKLERFRRVISSPSSSNDSAYIREILEDIFTSSLKICQKRGNFNVCPRGRPELRGELEPRVTKGG